MAIPTHIFALHAAALAGFGALALAAAAHKPAEASTQEAYTTVPATLCTTDSECADLLVGYVCKTAGGDYLPTAVYAKQEDEFPAGGCASIERLG